MHSSGKWLSPATPRGHFHLRPTTFARPEIEELLDHQDLLFADAIGLGAVDDTSFERHQQRLSGLAARERIRPFQRRIARFLRARYVQAREEFSENSGICHVTVHSMQPNMRLKPIHLLLPNERTVQF